MEFTCPTCGQLVEQQPEAGGYVKCPSCRRWYFDAQPALTSVPGWTLGVLLMLAVRLAGHG